MSSTLMRERVERVNTGTVSGVNNVMREVDTSSEFTDFVANNYEKLVREAVKFGIDPDLSVDLINDVWKSYKLDEANGNGYDMCKGKKDGFISIEQSVYGRIKRYAMNPRYQKATEAPKYNKETKKFSFKEVPCSYTTDDLDQLTGCQKAYAQMNSYDDLGSVEDKLALAENIHYLLGFGDKLGLPVLSAIETLRDMRDNLQGIDMSIFKGFKEADREFREAFSAVFKSAVSEPEYFDAVLAQAKNEFNAMAAVVC